MRDYPLLHLERNLSKERCFYAVLHFTATGESSIISSITHILKWVLNRWKNMENIITQRSMSMHVATSLVFNGCTIFGKIKQFLYEWNQ